MKNVNIKKVVAGAAALAIAAGSLGAVVSAANVADSSYTTPNGLARADMFNAQGAPSYNIVVGSTGHASDVVWAANIAAAIGKKAYNVSTASATGGDVVVEVGAEGVTSVSGDGKLYDKEVLNASSAIVLRNTDASFLNSESIDVDGTTVFGGAGGNSFSSSKMTVKDQINIDGATFGFNKDKDVADLVASFPDRSITYTMTFSGNGLPVNYKDSDSDERVKIKFMGKDYIVDEVTATSVKLLLDKSDLSLIEGATFEPENGYIIEVVEILQSSVAAGVNYEVELVLKDTEGNVIKTDVFNDGDAVFKNELDAVVNINKVYNSRVTITTGASSSITLTDGSEIDDFPEKDDELWEVELYQTSGAVTTHVDTIEIKNNLDYEFIDEDALKVGESLDIFGGLASVDFVGLSNETKFDFKIENNVISYVDALGNELDLFMYERRTGTDITKYTTRGMIDGHKLYFEFTPTADTVATNAGTFTVQLDDSDGEYLNAATGAWGAVAVPNAYADEDWAALKIASYENSAIVYDYGIMITTSATDKVTEMAIGLAELPVLASMDGVATGLDLSLVDIDPKAAPKTNSALGYYGALTASTAVSAEYQSYGEFVLTDGVNNIKVYVDVFTGKLVDTESTNFDDLSYMVDEGTYTLGVRNSDDLKWGMTDNGIKFEIASKAFNAEIPENALTARVFIGGGSSSETTLNGGEVTLTTPGEVVETEDGKISVKLVSAPQGSATTYTPAAFGNIAYLDTDTLPAGNKIIVGGWMVNEEAKTLGLEDLVTKAGDFVAGKNAQGNIVVAGFHKEDTANAAKELITAIEAMN